MQSAGEVVWSMARGREWFGGPSPRATEGDANRRRPASQHPRRHPVSGGMAGRTGRRADLQPDGRRGDGRNLTHTDLAVASPSRRARRSTRRDESPRRAVHRGRIRARSPRSGRGAVHSRQVPGGAGAFRTRRPLRAARGISDAVRVRSIGDRIMTSATSTPATLLDLISPVPAANVAIILPESNIRITYGELRQQVEALAEMLAGAGVKRGDRIGIALPNGLPMILSFLAASMAGTAAPLNPAYKEEEFRFYLEDTAARVLIVPAEGADAARRAAGDRIPVLTIGQDASGRVSFANATMRQSFGAPGIDDVALVLHTSGSTGRPKRVPLAHANLSISAQNVARSYALTAADVSLCVMPLFHVHGLVASTLATLSTGGTVVVPGKFNPLSFWRTAKDVGATWYSAVPTLHQLLLARADPNARARPAAAERLRFIRSCSASL